MQGYQSDITRTTVFGKPTARQTEIWNLERRAQDAAFAAAQPGATCGSVDAAARKVITDAGFGPGYAVPGLPHRTGHGIGMDGHEAPNFVKGSTVVIQPGMCFSDEPTISIYGEFGIRLEDCLYVTESGPRFFAPSPRRSTAPFPEALTSMDRQTLVLFIPILALSIPAIVMGGSLAGPLEEARSAPAPPDGAMAELEQMRGDMEQLRRNWRSARAARLHRAAPGPAARAGPAPGNG